MDNFINIFEKVLNEQIKVNPPHKKNLLYIKNNPKHKRFLPSKHFLVLPNKVNIAKKAKQGKWKITPTDAIKIAQKYNFYLPNKKEPYKHLSATGVILYRTPNGKYYLIKHPSYMRKPRRKSFTSQQQISTKLFG